MKIILWRKTLLRISLKLAYNIFQFIEKNFIFVVAFLFFINTKHHILMHHRSQQ